MGHFTNCQHLWLLALLFAAQPVAASQFNYPDFTNASGLTMVGDSTVVGPDLYVTPTAAAQAGATWFSTKQHVASGFDTVFELEFANINGHGADGLAFVVQNSTPDALGCPAGAIGYGTNPYHEGSGIPNSIAIEFDAFRNTEPWLDPDHNHISVQTRGLLPNHPDPEFSLGSSSAIPDLSDGAAHLARVLYEAGELSVFVEDLDTPALSIPLDLSSVLNLDNGSAWVGFTAGTGSLAGAQSHVIHSWSFIPEPSTSMLLAFSTAMALRRFRMK